MVQNQPSAWWNQDTENVAHAQWEYLSLLDNEQTYRQEENFKFLRIYGSQNLDYLRGFTPARAIEYTSTQNRITLNIVQSMIDTVVAKIAKNKPRPQVLTENGDFSQQRRAKKLSQFIEGQMYACEFYAKSAIAFLDACIFGTGVLKIYREEGEIKVDRIFIDEIKVDDRECIYGAPRQIHQEKWVHRDVLISMFPEQEVLIRAATSPQNSSYVAFRPSAPDMVLVKESWKLPNKKGAKDGRHVMCIQNHTLFDETWEKDYFPFIFWRWGLRPLGFFGQGLAEQLQGLQIEINKILRTIQVSMHLVSVPKLFVEASSKIVSAHLDNRIGSVIKYAGTMPTPGQLGIIPPELFAHLDRLYTRAYEIAGVSQLSATSAKPAGLNSGKALREYNDLETERFMTVAQRYEKCFLDAVPHMLDLAKEIDEELREQGGYKVKIKGKKFLETIKWKDVNMDEDQYTMQVFPASALSSTPQGRLADIQELIQAGFMSKEDAMKLLDFPDLQNFYNYANAAVENIDKAIERMIEDGEYMTPEPYQNLAFGIERMQQAYLRYQNENAPEERLELLRRWMADARGLLERAAIDGTRQDMEQQAQIEAMAQQDLDAGTPAPAAAMQESAGAEPMPPQIEPEPLGPPA
jgi:hypothetical protein